MLGYVLSPLSWWNDLYVNLPIAYLGGNLAALVERHLFAPGMIATYWASNVLGLLLLHLGGARSVQLPHTPLKPVGLRSSLLLSLLYTGVVCVLYWAGVLKPVTDYLGSRH